MDNVCGENKKIIFKFSKSMSYNMLGIWKTMATTCRRALKIIKQKLFIFSYQNWVVHSSSFPEKIQKSLQFKKLRKKKKKLFYLAKKSRYQIIGLFHGTITEDRTKLHSKYNFFPFCAPILSKHIITYKTTSSSLTTTLLNFYVHFVG